MAKETGGMGVVDSFAPSMGGSMNLKGAPGEYDHLPSAGGLDKPRSMGSESLPEKITDGALGATPPAMGSGINSTDFVPGGKR